MRSAFAGWIAALAMVAASCSTTGRGQIAAAGAGARESVWVARPRRTTPLLALVRPRPELADLTLYLQARDAARAGDDASAIQFVTVLVEQHPDSIWLPGARIIAGQLRRKAGDLDGARGWFQAAREGLPPGNERWVTSTLALGDVEHLRGDDAAALALARAVRAARPSGIAARRAKRLSDRIRRARPELWSSATSRLADAELLLDEDDAASAAVEAQSVLDEHPRTENRAQALWIRARAEHTLGERSQAEATCLEVADLSPALGPKAISAAARWRWNADDDATALRLYRQVPTRFPAAPEAAEARYAMGRIHQEAGRYDEAFDVYDRLARDEPRAPVASEARFRAGWVRYLSGDLPGASAYFAAIVVDGPPSIRPAAAYWEGRIRSMLRDPEADADLSAVVTEHPTSYYAGLAAERLGIATDAPTTVIAPPSAALPDDLPGPHSERARVLASFGLYRLAERELDAIPDDVPRLALAQAYTAVGAPGAAIVTARGLGSDADDTARRYLYPLGFWPVVEHEAQARGLDPLLVAALIRQESLFLPEAISPADAQGLMQLLPRTARVVADEAGVTPAEVKALDVVPTNVRLGTTLLRRLLDRYDGSRVKALAAYNAGEDAVAKWERRYGARPDDEFAELISYRETRDYVKLVLQNLQIYRQLYGASPPATSRGNPPNAPFDMMTTTSPGVLVATR